MAVDADRHHGAGCPSGTARQTLRRDRPCEAPRPTGIAGVDPLRVPLQLAELTAPNQNIENNPMQSSRRSPAWMLFASGPIKTISRRPAVAARRDVPGRATCNLLCT